MSAIPSRRDDAIEFARSELLELLRADIRAQIERERASQVDPRIALADTYGRDQLRTLYGGMAELFACLKEKAEECGTHPAAASPECQIVFTVVDFVIGRLVDEYEELARVLGEAPH